MKIGLTQRILYFKDKAYDCLEHGWYSLLNNHTLIPVPNKKDQDFKQIAEHSDLLIITGGDDSPTRRLTEIKLATEILKYNKPILGICHGAFLLTDIMGGVVSTCNSHMDIAHTVTADNDTFLVNSFHSLQITNLHSTGTSIATDPDGFCEAWVDGNISGIVWHPERMTTPFIPRIIKKLTGL